MAGRAKSSESPGPQGGLYVVCGSDPFLVGRQVDRLLDQWLTAEQRPMCLWQPDANAVSAAEVFDELRTLPFLAPCRVVVLRDADEFVSANRKALEAYLDEAGGTGMLVLAVKSWRANTRLAKRLSGLKPPRVFLVDVPPWKLAGWAGTVAQQDWAKTLERAAAERLVELTGDDPGRVAQEVEKLAVYVDRRRTIRIDDVERLVGQNRVFGAFDVIDAMMAGDTAAALERLRRMFEASRSAEYTTVGAFAYHFRKLFSARVMLEDGAGPDQVARQLRVRRKDAFFRQVRRFPLKRIAEMLARLAHIDYGIKTGRTTAPVAMERLVLELMGQAPAVAVIDGM